MLGLVLVLGAPALKDKQPVVELYGLWEFELSEDAKDKDLRNYRYRFNKEGTWQVFEGELEVAAARGFQFDAKAKIPPIDFNTPPTDSASPLVFGIYKIEGDQLTICSGGPGQPRPTSFEVLAGSSSYLQRLHRVKTTN